MKSIRMSICVLKLYSLKEHSNYIEFLKPSSKKGECL